MGFKVFVNYTPKKSEGQEEAKGERKAEEKGKEGKVDESEESKFQKVLRLKKDRLCEGSFIRLLSS